MADADFGYVGSAPGKINLYVGKTAVKFNIPEAKAVDRLQDLIREHGKWVDPVPQQAEPALTQTAHRRFFNDSKQPADVEHVDRGPECAIVRS